MMRSMTQNLHQFYNDEFPFKSFLVQETSFGDHSDFNVTEVVNGMPGQQLRLSKDQYHTLVDRLLANGWFRGNSSVD